MRNKPLLITGEEYSFFDEFSGDEEFQDNPEVSSGEMVRARAKAALSCDDLTEINQALNGLTDIKEDIELQIKIFKEEPDTCPNYCKRENWYKSALTSLYFYSRLFRALDSHRHATNAIKVQLRERGHLLQKRWKLLVNALHQITVDRCTISILKNTGIVPSSILKQVHALAVIQTEKQMSLFKDAPNHTLKKEILKSINEMKADWESPNSNEEYSSELIKEIRKISKERIEQEHKSQIAIAQSNIEVARINLEVQKDKNAMFIDLLRNRNIIPQEEWVSLWEEINSGWESQRIADSEKNLENKIEKFHNIKEDICT